MSLEDSIEAIVRRVVREVVREEFERAKPSAAPSEPAELRTVDQVAERCKVTPATVREWIRGGRLKAQKPGRHYLVEPAELARFLAQQCAADAKLDSDEHLELIIGRLEKTA